MNTHKVGDRVVIKRANSDFDGLEGKVKTLGGSVVLVTLLESKYSNSSYWFANRDAVKVFVPVDERAELVRAVDEARSIYQMAHEEERKRNYVYAEAQRALKAYDHAHRPKFHERLDGLGIGAVIQYRLHQNARYVKQHDGKWFDGNSAVPASQLLNDASKWEILSEGVKA